MFKDFQLAGLSIENLTVQVIGILNNPFLVSAIAATLALGFSHLIVATVKAIVGNPDGVTENLANEWNYHMAKSGHTNFMIDEGRDD